MSAAIERDDHGVIQVRGELTFDTVTMLLSQSKRLFDGQGEITIDLEQVTHANSAGLALLLEWLSQSRNSGQTIHFRHVPEALISIADLCNLREVLSQ